MTCAVSAAVREGAQAVICASTGNTAASAAAYSARAGLRGAVIVPEGKIATGKLAQALMHGARVVALRGNFDEALKLVRELVNRHPISLVNSVNEFRIEGQKTAAFEIVEDLAGELDALCIPVGNAGNITAYWKGFREVGHDRRMLGFQAAGAARSSERCWSEVGDRCWGEVRKRCWGEPTRAVVDFARIWGQIDHTPGTQRAMTLARRRLVRVPASSANLGPGFDTLAAALALHLELEVRETGTFAVHTDLAVRRDRDNLVVRAFERPHPADDLDFHVTSRIP